MRWHWPSHTQARAGKHPRVGLHMNAQALASMHIVLSRTCVAGVRSHPSGKLLRSVQSAPKDRALRSSGRPRGAPKSWRPPSSGTSPSSASSTTKNRAGPQSYAPIKKMCFLPFFDLLRSSESLDLSQWTPRELCVSLRAPPSRSRRRCCGIVAPRTSTACGNIATFSLRSASPWQHRSAPTRVMCSWIPTTSFTSCRRRPRPR